MVLQRLVVCEGCAVSACVESHECISCLSIFYKLCYETCVSTKYHVQRVYLVLYIESSSCESCDCYFGIKIPLIKIIKSLICVPTLSFKVLNN